MADRAYWFWCWLCFKMFMALPHSRTHESVYGRFMLWLLSYAGYYAYYPRHDATPPQEQR